MPSEFQRLREEGKAVVHGPRKVRGLSKAVAKERASERSRRHAEARRRAWVVLASRYPDEVAALYKQELDALNEERGPLPGDPT